MVPGSGPGPSATARADCRRWSASCSSSRVRACASRSASSSGIAIGSPLAGGVVVGPLQRDIDEARYPMPSRIGICPCSRRHAHRLKRNQQVADAGLRHWSMRLTKMRWGMPSSSSVRKRRGSRPAAEPDLRSTTTLRIRDRYAARSVGRRTGQAGAIDDRIIAEMGEIVEIGFRSVRLGSAPPRCCHRCSIRFPVEFSLSVVHLTEVEVPPPAMSCPAGRSDQRDNPRAVSGSGGELSLPPFSRGRPGRMSSGQRSPNRIASDSFGRKEGGERRSERRGGSPGARSSSRCYLAG